MERIEDLKKVYHEAIRTNDETLLIYLHRTKRYAPAGQILKLKLNRLKDELFHCPVWALDQHLHLYNKIMRLAFYIGNHDN